MFNKILSKVIGGIILLSIGYILGSQFNTVSEDVPTQIENETRVIDAGYISYAPGFIVDPNTKEMSGIFYEVLEEIADRNQLEINYKEEVTRATLVEVLETNRVEMIASPVWVTDVREANADFSKSLFDSPIGAFVRAEDNRFDISTDSIKDPSVNIVAIDGEGGQVIAMEDFSEAELTSLPNTVDLAQLLLEVEAGKADVTFAEPIFAYEYMQQNPGKLKNVAEGKNAVKNRPNSFMLQQGDSELQKILNDGLQDLANDGTLDRIIDKYEPFSNAVTRVR